MSKYVITVKNLHDRMARPTIIRANGLVQLMWRHWKIYKIMRQVYNILPGQSFGVIVEENSEPRVMKYGWIQGNTYVPAVEVTVDFLED